MLASDPIGALGDPSSAVCGPKTFLDEKLELAHRNTSQTIQKRLGNAHTGPRISILSRGLFRRRYRIS